MKKIRFYKDSTGWYADIPEWTGTKADLQMVCGADVMLDILSDSNNEVTLYLNTAFFENSNTLTLKHEDKENGGGWYKMEKYLEFEFNHELWLCEVTRFVFGEIPPKIYFKVDGTFL